MPERTVVWLKEMRWCVCVLRSIQKSAASLSLSLSVCMSLAPVYGHMNRAYRADYIIPCKRHPSCPHATSVKDVNEYMQKRCRLYFTNSHVLCRVICMCYRSEVFKLQLREKFRGKNVKMYNINNNIISKCYIGNNNNNNCYYYCVQLTIFIFGGLWKPLFYDHINVT